MSFIIDLIIIAAAAAAVIHGITKGFVRSAMRFASIIIALSLTFALTPVVSRWIDNGFVKDRVSEVTQETLTSIVNTGSDEREIDEVLNDRPSSLSKFAERFGFDVSELENYYHSFLGDLTRSDALERLSSKIAEPASSAVSTALAAIVVFIASLIICAIITKILDLLCRLPVLKQLNKLLGTIFGVASALLSAWIIANISVGLINALQTLRGDIFNDSVIEGSIILKFFVDSGLVIF